ncbi:MAG: hypothetical protein WBX25_15225 [Rhodomicrobium sp.]
MTLDADKVEAILRHHWKIPTKFSSSELHDQAYRILVLVRQKYSHDNLKYQLSLIQTKKLQQELDDQACDQIVTDLLQAVKA